MSNVKDIKPQVTTIMLRDGVEREIRFTLNAMVELEDKYGSVEKAFEALENNSIKAARFILWAALLHTEEGLTEQQVGNLIDLNTLGAIMDKMSSAMESSMPQEGEQGKVAQLPNA